MPYMGNTPVSPRTIIEVTFFVYIATHIIQTFFFATLFYNSVIQDIVFPEPLKNLV